MADPARRVFCPLLPQREALYRGDGDKTHSYSTDQMLTLSKEKSVFSVAMYINMTPMLTLLPGK